MAISKDSDKVFPLFIDDTRVEETFAETLAYVHGMGIVQGSAVLERQTKFVATVCSFPLYLMFNRNTLAKIENEVIADAMVRDFILTLFTKFATIMSIRDKNFSVNHLISSLENVAVSTISLGIDTEVSKTLIKNLTDGIVPTNNTVKEYLTKNRWYIAVLLLNVFSISSLKVMDDIKRPPVKNEGT
ncbi:MAG: hypothetical protein RR877_01055 [Aurantimicrobium sp.]|uniref:hypothetical protein n=1 Tax=Aurantimicrobium sp. TaxID=1930784 RepID=UPI002FCB636F